MYKYVTFRCPFFSGCCVPKTMNIGLFNIKTTDVFETHGSCRYCIERDCCEQVLQHGVTLTVAAGLYSSLCTSVRRRLITMTSAA